MKPKFGAYEMNALGFLLAGAGTMLVLLLLAFALAAAGGGNPYAVP